MVSRSNASVGDFQLSFSFQEFGGELDHLVAEDPAVLPLYNTDPLNEQETAVLDLFQLTSLGSDGSKDDERFFLATVGAVFLNVDVDAASDVAAVGLLPPSDFVGLFAVGIK